MAVRTAGFCAGTVLQAKSCRPLGCFGTSVHKFCRILPRSPRLHGCAAACLSRLCYDSGGGTCCPCGPCEAMHATTVLCSLPKLINHCCFEALDLDSQESEREEEMEILQARALSARFATPVLVPRYSQGLNSARHCFIPVVRLQPYTE